MRGYLSGDVVAGVLTGSPVLNSTVYGANRIRQGNGDYVCGNRNLDVDCSILDQNKEEV